ncbi:MAG: glycerol-3-phosphate 1-O-acyltransferase PlsY [Hyphomicrobiaceae bacterium]|nr:glycerol-3-phosphate 1-O-acyltransferase PlsY [Hyphomicrobiaceae bacterium]
MIAAALALCLGYLLGSIPFGLVLTRAAGLGDVRNIGSGNIGATNVLRTGNKKLAAMTLLLDTLKGTVAVLVGWWLGTMVAGDIAASSTTTPAAVGIEALVGDVRARIIANAIGLAAGVGAFLGHVFPVWLGFKGGKGVATYIGVLIGAAWPAALVFALAWLLTAAATKYSSLSALVATLVVFIYLAATGGPFVASAAAIMSALLYWKHRENIKRLVAGTESKIGAKG